MTDHLLVEPATPADFPRLAEVWEASVRATHDFLAEGDIEYFRPLVEHEFLPQVELVCVRDAAGRPIAFAGVAEDKLEMLFVDPAWRGCGVGRELLRHAVARMGAILVDVNEQNQQAVGFYRRMGFEVTGRSPVDTMGKPYPLLHLRYLTTPGAPAGG